MSLRTSVFSVTTLSFQQTTSRIIIYSDSNISTTVEIIPGGTSQRPKLRRWPLNNTVGSYPHLLASYHNAWNAILGNVTKAIRCYKDLYMKLLYPRKLTCPLKKLWLENCYPFWKWPLFKGHISFWGAYFYVKPWQSNQIKYFKLPSLDHKRLLVYPACRNRNLAGKCCLRPSVEWPQGCQSQRFFQFQATSDWRQSKTQTTLWAWAKNYMNQAWYVEG